MLILSVEGSRVFLVVRALMDSRRGARLVAIIGLFARKNQLLFRRHSAPFPRQFPRTSGLGGRATYLVAHRWSFSRGSGRHD
jgi:hypothetical protein